jgi:Bax protein
MALTMNYLKQGVFAVAAVAVCMASGIAGISRAAAEDGDAGTMGWTLNAASSGLRSMQVRAPVTGANSGSLRSRSLRPGSMRLATLMTFPARKLDWRPPRRFDRRALLDLSLSELRQGKAAVPPVYLSRFPADLAAASSPKQRKEIFIKTVLPLVLRANHEVRMERRRMLSLIVRADIQGGLAPRERAFLDYLAVQYEVPVENLSELRQRVDVIPASLALAQGAEESGWGTSRFARLGNAVFGQRTFRKGGGLVPLRREQGLRHEVKAFNSLYTSVRAYVWNLNTHYAYGKFRAKRAAFRQGGRPLDGYALTETLDRYSERGKKYIETIRVIMRANRLHEFDDVELLPESAGGRPS